MCRLISVGLILISSLCMSVFGDRIEIPAYEYIKRFNGPLDLGQCPNRIVSLPDPTREYCTFPNRPGIPKDKPKNVEYKLNEVIHGASDLFNRIGLCDQKSVAYFGLLNDGDCVASEIASKLSFKRKHVTRLYLEHYRPLIRTLQPSRDLGVPAEFTNHLNNTYYTENIGVGTEEAIIIEMQFAKAVHSQKASTHKMGTTSMSRILRYTARFIGLPKKVKVIRYSTADKRLTTKVFKGSNGFEKAMRHVQDCERRIHEIRQQIRHDLDKGVIRSHLKYGFKAYELQAPVALPLVQGPSYTKRPPHHTEAQNHKIWEEVTLLQVEAKRVYVTYKRFRKPCRFTTSRDPKHKYCLLVKHTLREMKGLVTNIHTRRRDWRGMTFTNRERFVSEGRMRVKLLKTRLHSLTKALKQFLKKSKTKTG